MLLQGKNAVIYGAAGAIGRIVARTFAREGARVVLVGRTAATLQALAQVIATAGGVAETAPLDALDEHAVEQHADLVVRKAGRMDISFNLVSIPHVQGTPLLDLPIDDFTLPLMQIARTQLLTARAAARHMVTQRSGVILMMTTTPARMAFPRVGAFGAACAATEGLAHTLAAELGPHGIRVLCLLSTGSPETAGVQEVSELHAKGAGKTPEEWLDDYRRRTLLRRMTALADVAEMAAFMASDRASATTGTAVNLTCGALVD
jgi:NAD(P)-dependent dehydrogenase (short-subunit alcohol dehydrogenase family)